MMKHSGPPKKPMPQNQGFQVAPPPPLTQARIHSARLTAVMQETVPPPRPVIPMLLVSQPPRSQEHLATPVHVAALSPSHLAGKRTRSPEKTAMEGERCPDC